MRDVLRFDVFRWFTLGSRYSSSESVVRPERSLWLVCHPARAANRRTPGNLFILYEIALKTQRLVASSSPFADELFSRACPGFIFALHNRYPSVQATVCMPPKAENWPFDCLDDDPDFVSDFKWHQSHCLMVWADCLDETQNFLRSIHCGSHSVSCVM